MVYSSISDTSHVVRMYANCTVQPWHNTILSHTKVSCWHIFQDPRLDRSDKFISDTSFSIFNLIYVDYLVWWKKGLALIFFQTYNTEIKFALLHPGSYVRSAKSLSMHPNTKSLQYTFRSKRGTASWYEKKIEKNFSNCMFLTLRKSVGLASNRCLFR